MMERDLISNAVPASASAGEMTFTRNIPNQEMSLGVEIAPLRYFLQGIGKLLTNIKGVFKDKKRFIPVLIISIIWLFPLLLSSLGLKSSTMNWLSFLTFAKGGTGGGLFGMVGGLIGKGFFTYFIFAMILPLFTGGKPFSSLSKGLKTLFAAFGNQEKSSLAPLLLGAAIALMAYNFLTGNASLQNSMVCIAAFLLSLRALANKGGFLRGFLMSLLYKSNKGQKVNTSIISRFLVGWTSGFALGIPLSTTGIAGIGYLSGLILIIGAAILKMITGSKKEAR